MKSEITSLDLHYLVREFQQLVGARVDKFYEQSDDKKEFLLVFHKTGSGKMMLRIKLPGLVYLTEHKQVFPETPPGFCVFLRKHLGSARIKEIRQHGFERILEIAFDTKEGDSILICELFSKGNMILVDEELKIKGLLESQNWQARTVRGGSFYEYPPAQASTPSLGEAEIRNTLKNSNKDSVVKALAVELGLGGLYAEELCMRAGVPKDKKDIDDTDISALSRELKKLFNEDIRAAHCAGEIVPFGLSLFESQEKQSFESFNSALDSILSDKFVSVSEQKEQKEKKTKHDKIKVVLEKQNERLAELEKGIVDNQRKGEMIYEHYQEIKELLEQFNSDRKKLGWEELRKKYKDSPLVKEMDEKTGKIAIELN